MFQALTQQAYWHSSFHGTLEAASPPCLSSPTGGVALAIAVIFSWSVFHLFFMQGPLSETSDCMHRFSVHRILDPAFHTFWAIIQAPLWFPSTFLRRTWGPKPQEQFLGCSWNDLESGLGFVVGSHSLFLFSWGRSTPPKAKALMLWVGSSTGNV